MNEPVKRAPLRNIELLLKAVDEAVKRPHHLPGFVPFSGFSGYGKSYAAAFVSAKYGCFYIEVSINWSTGTLLDNILKEMGIQPTKGTIADKETATMEALQERNKPLIIDEFDYLVSKPRALETIKGIQDKTGIPIIIIGEELLPHKLKKTERFHNRVLKWVRAEKVNLEDAKKLAALYCEKLTIKEDLLQKLIDLSQGRVRRVCVNLENIKKEAKLQGWKEIDLATWGKRELYTGDAPDTRMIK